MEFSPIIIAIILLLVFLLLKVPVFVSLLASSVTYFFLTPSIPPQLIAQRVISGVESIPLLAIPFFICAGVLMNHSGVTSRVMGFCELLVGKMTGGLAQVNVMLSVLMGGLSGSNLADAAMQAKMLVPEMEKRGFSKQFSTVITASSAILTTLIPPSITMIIYGSVANVSIGKIFIAGLGPALLVCASMMILVRIISKKRNYTSVLDKKITPSGFLNATIKALPPLLLPIVIIGGIRLGIFTPTEAGSAALVYILILGIIYREMSFKDFIGGLKDSVITTASVMLIIGTASAFAWILTKERIPQEVTAFLIEVIQNKYIFLIVVNLFLLILGMFIEGNALMIVLVPLLAPVAHAFGINEIHFAIIFIFNMALGALSPPVGTLMFVTCGVTRCKIKDFIIEAIPFYILLFTCLMLVTYVPFISLALVDLIY